MTARQLKRAALAAVAAAVVLAASASGASAVTINPAGPFDMQGTVLQTFNIPSIGRTYTCRWRLQGVLLVPQIPLVTTLQAIGGVQAATIACNQTTVIITPLVSPLGTLPGPWTIGLTPGTGVLGLPTPTGVLVTLLGVRIRVQDTAAPGFSCLFTGTIGLLVSNGPQPQVQLLGGSFRATPVAGDTCPAGLPATKGAGQYQLIPPWVIGP